MPQPGYPALLGGTGRSKGPTVWALFAMRLDRSRFASARNLGRKSRLARDPHGRGLASCLRQAAWLVGFAFVTHGLSGAGLPLGRRDGWRRGDGQMCCDAREPLAGCTRSEAESNQSLRMMLLRAAAGSATKFGREHSDRVLSCSIGTWKSSGHPAIPAPQDSPWSDPVKPVTT